MFLVLRACFLWSPQLRVFPWAPGISQFFTLGTLHFKLWLPHLPLLRAAKLEISESHLEPQRAVSLEASPGGRKALTLSVLVEKQESQLIVLNKWASVCLKALTAIIFSTACFLYQPLNTQSQGECTKRLHCLFAGAAEWRVWNTGLQGQKRQRGASHCVAPLERQELPFLKQLCSPTRGCSLRLHLIVVSKLWLDSCRRYSCNRQACSSATYLFKWVQKFSASWQLFFPPLFYTNQLIC